MGPIASLKDILDGSPPTKEVERIGYALRIYEFEIAISLGNWSKAEDIVKASRFPTCLLLAIRPWLHSCFLQFRLPPD
jgi:hypothetical protein